MDLDFLFRLAIGIVLLAIILPPVLMLMATPFVIIGTVIWQVAFGIYDLFFDAGRKR